MRARALVVCLVVAACDNGGATPDWSRMITQPKLLPYGATTLFDDGRAMRPLPTGAVAREWVADRELREGRTATGQAVGAFPMTVTRPLLERGRARFQVLCAACHGVAGDGDSPVAHNMQRRRPPSLHETRLVALTPGAMYRVIVDGYGLMPSYQQVLTVDDRWAVVAYVRALELSWRANLDALPGPIRADVIGRLP